jgi:hypothetical protein
MLHWLQSVRYKLSRKSNSIIGISYITSTKNEMKTLLKQALKKSTFLPIGIVLTLSACEEVIEIDLNTSTPKMVFEGVIEKDSAAWIKLTYTTDYFTTEEPTFVDDATVVLTDKSGNSEKLNYQGEGLYKGEWLKGKEKEDYCISVEGSGYTYQAETELMAQSQIYSVSFEKQESKVLGEKTDSYDLTIKFSDNPETENFYLIKFLINDSLTTKNYIYVKDSYYTPNNVFEYSPMRIEFQQNDKVDIWLYSIDEGSYTYFNQLNDISGSEIGSSSTPYNAQSNFGSDVLGYFMAISYDSIQVIVE